VRFTKWVALLVLLGCGGTQTQTETEPTEDTTEEPEVADTESAPEHMREHFADVAAARDAVIQGDIEGVRAPLSRIAAAEYGEDLPWDWRQWVGEMQNSAGGYAEVSDILAAANAVAALTESCADCHRTTLGGPAIPAEHQPPHEHNVQGEMQRHAWGVEQLWLGLTAPSHEAWARGAAAIMEDPMTPEEAEALREEEENEALTPHLEELRALGEQAHEAGQPADKARVYAQIISKCAICHSGLDGRR
jgi:hypothetical protein